MGSAEATTQQLRALVREVMRDALPELMAARRAPTAEAHSPMPIRPPTVDPAPPDATDVGGHPADGVELVRLDNDRDLDAFVLRLIRQCENPKFRSDVRSGKHRFTLAPSGVRATSGPVPHRRIDKGAVTEAHVKDAARAGVSLMLGPRAVLTPLARDKARSLGVVIEKERPC